MAMFGSVLKKLFQSKGAVKFVGLVVVSYLLASIAPYLNGAFIDFLITNKDIRSVVQFAIIVAAIGIICAAVSYFSSIATVQVSTRTTYLYIKDWMDEYLRADLIAVEDASAAYTTQRVVTDVNAVVRFVVGSFLAIPLTALLSLFICIFFFIINSTIAIMALALVVVYLILFYKSKTVLLDASKNRKEAESVYFSSIESEVNGIFETQLRSSYDVSLRHFENAFSRYYPAIICANRAVYKFGSADSVISSVFQAVLLVIAGVQIIMGNMTIGEFTMISSYFALLLNGTKKIVGFYQQYQDARASNERLLEFERKCAKATGTKKFEKICSIDLDGVSFSVAGHEERDERPLLNNLNYHFCAGTTNAVVGDNGCGKSTLIKLMTGLYDSKGSIKYNETSVQQVDIDSVHQNNMAVVPQNISPLNMSVKEYLAECLNIKEADVQIALSNRENGLSGYSGQLSNLLEANCRSLSGGELRKLYLWISVNIGADVLMFDEPSTGLDSASKSELIEFINDNPNNQIIILMTHDIALVDAADFVLCLAPSPVNEFAREKRKFINE